MHGYEHVWLVTSIGLAQLGTIMIGASFRGSSEVACLLTDRLMGLEQGAKIRSTADDNEQGTDTILR